MSARPSSGGCSPPNGGREIVQLQLVRIDLRDLDLEPVGAGQLRRPAGERVVEPERAVGADRLDRRVAASEPGREGRDDAVAEFEDAAEPVVDT
jgi:hypothetical protein